MPLSVSGTTATFLGSCEVCDYQDLVSGPGGQQQVLEAVLEHLAMQGVRLLDLRTLRPDALLLKALGSMEAVAHTIFSEEVSFETELPDSWEGYLQQLDGKQRHEVRRASCADWKARARSITAASKARTRQGLLRTLLWGCSGATGRTKRLS